MVWAALITLAVIWLVWLFQRLIRTLRYSFRDKVVLVTGGSRGLGLVLSRKLAGAGARLVLLARDPHELDRAKSELGRDTLTIQCDLLDRAQIDVAVQQALQHFGRIDIVINNAGIIEVGPIEHTQRSDFEQAMGVHFWAAFDIIWQVLPQMRAQRAGRIVNISSIGGKIAVPHLAAYSASKFALTGFSDAIRSELARDNIKVTTVCPGLMRTGSHVNAKTKGDHDAEFAWFAVAASTPVISISAERAARKILAACRRGQPSLELTMAARGAISANAVFPNLVAYAMKMTNHFLPGPTGAGGNEARRGWDSRLRDVVPESLTKLSDRATVRNNEQRPSFDPSGE
jgi:NAD(P)-dependent dehydrogenase (short-subunit alcohol dehydrogenase family)